MNLVLHLNGWPGTGKRTIAAILAAQIGARLLDNHVMLNPAEALFERGDPNHAALLDAVRSLTLDYAAHVPSGTPIIATNALSDDEADIALFDRYRTLATRRGARLAAVVLDIAPDENARRLQSPGRAGHRKLTRPDVLHVMRTQYRLLRPGADVLNLDVTNLSAADAASRILDWIGPA